MMLAMSGAAMAADMFHTPEPKSAAEWDKRKVETRKTLRRLLGDWPPMFVPKPVVDRKEQREGYTLEHYRFENGAGHTVYGYLMIPDGLKGRAPAILYNHYHGGAYKNGKEEVIHRAFKGLDFVTGEALVRRGYVVNAIDSYAFGERRFQGPAGEREQGSATEMSLFKMFLWQGRTLWGMMVRDDLLALNYLLSRPEVDPKRVATMGMSMGSTRSWWAAAMDDRIKATISVACLTRYQNILEHGKVSEHSIYYFVPGMLKERIDSETVVSLIAPRPHLTLTGDQDPGSPVDGVRIINEFAAKVYGVYGKPDAFRSVVYPGVGHTYNPDMWKETLEWLDKWLSAGSPAK